MSDSSMPQLHNPRLDAKKKKNIGTILKYMNFAWSFIFISVSNKRVLLCDNYVNFANYVNKWFLSSIAKKTNKHWLIVSKWTNFVLNYLLIAETACKTKQKSKKKINIDINIFF